MIKNNSPFSILNSQLQNRGTILLVEDNKKLNDANARALKLMGYDVHTALTLSEARDVFAQIIPDIILLDVMLPDGDGFSFCEEIRDKTQAHILFLTAKTEHEDMVKGLKTGGDDYITKPFHPEALMTKIDAAMRRRVTIGVPLLSIVKGVIKMDLASDQAFADGVDLGLSQKEFSLLCQLMQNEDRVLSPEYLYSKVWNQPMAGNAGAIRKIVSKLRKKLEGSGYTITPEYGKGYCFERG